jgi:hypothetical protein
MTDEASRGVKINGYEVRCKACNFPGHEEHDAALLTGKLSDSEYAKLVGCAPPSIGRHRAHISATLLKATEIEAVANSDSLLTQLQEARNRTLSLLDKAEDAQDTKVYGPPVGYLREIREQLKLLAELEGRIAAQPTINVTVSAEWIKLRTVIITALDPFPQAKEAMIDAISGR